MPAADDALLDSLIEAAYVQALALFRKEAGDGTRDPRQEVPVYRRRRRDYLLLLRLGRAPDEARRLAATLLDTHGIDPDPARREQFETDVTRMLARLYDAFLAEAE